MIKDKGGKNVERKLVVEVKVASALVNMVDVHVAIIHSKANEEHVFKDMKLRRTKQQ
jgi:hypothetical protein